MWVEPYNPFMYGVHVFTKSAHRSSRAALQSHKVYPPRLGSWPTTGIAARQINAIRSKMSVRFTIAISALLFVLPSWAQAVKYGSPSILSQCLDPPSSSTGYGPSTRARECTRLYCARPEYRALVEAYAMRRPQSEDDQNRALICITRSEQDQQRK